MCVNRYRSPTEILGAFSRFDYTLDGNDGMFAIARIVDKAAKTVRADKAYLGKALPFDFVTRPEIEMLMVIKEHALQAWDKASNRNSKLKVSEFCKSSFKYNRLKSRDFLEDYWSDVDELVRCIHEYHQLAKKKGYPYLDLSDLLA